MLERGGSLIGIRADCLQEAEYRKVVLSALNHTPHPLSEKGCVLRGRGINMGTTVKRESRVQSTSAITNSNDRLLRGGGPGAGSTTRNWRALKPDKLCPIAPGDDLSSTSGKTSGLSSRSPISLLKRTVPNASALKQPLLSPSSL